MTTLEGEATANSDQEVVKRPMIFLLNVAIAAIALYVGTNTFDELTLILSTFAAVICLLLSIIFAPWPLQVLIVLLLIGSKLHLLRRMKHMQQTTLLHHGS